MMVFTSITWTSCAMNSIGSSSRRDSSITSVFIWVSANNFEKADQLWEGATDADGTWFTASDYDKMNMVRKKKYSSKATHIYFLKKEEQERDHKREHIMCLTRRDKLLLEKPSTTDTDASRKTVEIFIFLDWFTLLSILHSQVFTKKKRRFIYLYVVCGMVFSKFRHRDAKRAEVKKAFCFNIEFDWCSLNQTRRRTFLRSHFFYEWHWF